MKPEAAFPRQLTVAYHVRSSAEHGQDTSAHVDAYQSHLRSRENCSIGCHKPHHFSEHTIYVWALKV